ncbi:MULTISPECIES: ABC1 kinase family protein [Streptomyces]|uniref:ABC1 kinase family protein n=1 Tax=Streptomyces TaxID=1883 RepID=UPI00067BD94C|nr:MULTISPECIES: AarF/UbiB family protein [Streptomyces]
MTKGRTRRTAKIALRAVYSEASRSAHSRFKKTGTQDGLAAKHQRAVNIRATLEQLGPLYIKVGQILATRPDFVPQYVRDELEVLNDEATVTPFAGFEKILEDELGSDWKQRFQSIQTDEPLGAASLAQVYKGVMADGTPCAVKVQRPGAREAVSGDMEVLRKVARLISKSAPHFSEVVDVQAILEVLFTMMKNELDFKLEARNMKKARKAARRFKHISVPKVILATPRVLIQSFAEGVPINKVKPDSLPKKKRKKLAYELISFMFRSYFVERFFHADPHPGNVIVNDRGKAYMIDWGMVGRIDRGTSAALLGALLAFSRNDGAGLARQWINLGSLTPWSNSAAFTNDVARVLPNWHDATLEELNFGVAFMSVVKYSTARGIQVTPTATIAGKSVANIEGCVRCIYPKLKLGNALKGVMEGVLLDLWREAAAPDQIAQWSTDVLAMMSAVPGQLQALLDETSGGKFTIQARTNLGDPVKSGSRQRVSMGTKLSTTVAAHLAVTAARLKRNARQGRTGP